jgi:branched-chain amino acid transport system ATP-binding protein
MRAVEVISAEHRTLTAVIHAMLFVLRRIRFGISERNFDLLGVMVSYIETFPERFHHPKEDAYLFPRLRERDRLIVPLLDRLHTEHVAGSGKLQNMRRLLCTYQRNPGSREFGAFHEAVSDYAAFHYAHVRAEEGQVLPAATEYLKAADWDEIDSAFAGHSDPLFGAGAVAEYGELFRRIVDLAPAPLGLGREQGPVRAAAELRTAD